MSSFAAQQPLSGYWGGEVGCDMMPMSIGWVYLSDGKCLSDLDLPGLVIWACLGQAANVGKVLLGEWFRRSGNCEVGYSGFPNIGVGFNGSSSSDIIKRFGIDE